ncbi:MAG TPA: hypothetical protein PLO37_25170 [Candidatus Hydrogenedentes bacterium]|nr:hypothetical protein [Candidatus Hydrogenedentota bacterium]HPG70149.1 hypothetical protein [Candidatus Hydrogenedentota bacterium]
MKKLAHRILGSFPARGRTRWKDAIVFVEPDTVIRWQRKCVEVHWRNFGRGTALALPASPQGAD